MIKVLLGLSILFGAAATWARPHAGFTGLAAAADSAATAATNPAGAVRFDKTAGRIELMGVLSESTWEGRLGETGSEVKTEDSTSLVVPSGSLVRPINEDFSFAFTMLGYGYSDDFGDWPGRYMITSYEALSVSAFPSIAYRINDKWSVAGSLAIAYSSFTQERAVANIFDPGFGDGSSKIETDGWDAGFGLSTLYQMNERTRFGLAYMSELNPTQDGDAKFSNLGPNTSELLEQAGVIGADVEVTSRSPEAVLAGMYHEFDNNHSLTLDLAWTNFSNFELSEYYINGDQLSENPGNWEDTWAFSAGYSWPVGQRWFMSVGGLYVDDMVDDDDRIFMLRLDSIWSLAVAAEWQWTDTRSLEFDLSYLTIDDAPIASPEVPVVGSAVGQYTERNIYLLSISVNFGSL